MAEVDFEEAKELADYASIYQDLAYVVDALKRLKNLIEENSKDNILMQSLWTAALIGYARCFSSGKRFGLKESIFEKIPYNHESEDTPIKVHQLYIDLRNKHIAHSVNPFEQIKVGLVLSEINSPKREVQGVVTLLQKLMCLDLEGVVSFLKLSSLVHKEVAKICKNCEDNALKAGKILPIDPLYSRPILRIITPGPEDARKARS